MASLALSACATTGNVEVVSIVDAPRFARSLRRSNARLLVSTATRRGETPSPLDARRDTKLAADIRSLNLFSSVEVAAQGIERWCEPLAKLSVTRIESGKVEEGRWLGSMAKTIFTLGLAAPSQPVRKHLHSTVRLELQRWDGAHKVYESSGDAVVEYGFDQSSVATQQRLTTRVTWAALKQLAADTRFHLLAVDVLKVTKPHAVAAERVARKVQESAQPFEFATLAQVEDTAADCGQDVCIKSETSTIDGSTRMLSHVASPALGRYVVVSDPDAPNSSSPGELPVISRLVELSNPVAINKQNPFGFCEAVVYHHHNDTRTIYTSCDQKGWTARTELCQIQLQGVSR